MLKGTALRQVVMSPLEIGWHPTTVVMMSVWTRNPIPCSCLSSFPLKKTLCPSSVVVWPKFFHLISQSPRMFHLYLPISCVSSWSFPAAFSVLVFHLPMVMSLPRILDGAPDSSVLVYVGRCSSCWSWLHWISYDQLIGCHWNGDWRARYNLVEPIPVPVEHMAIEFVVEPFCLSGPSFLSRTSA